MVLGTSTLHFRTPCRDLSASSGGGLALVLEASTLHCTWMDLSAISGGGDDLVLGPITVDCTGTSSDASLGTKFFDGRDGWSRGGVAP